MSAARAHVQAPPLRFPLDGGALALFEPAHAVPLVSIVLSLRSGSAVGINSPTVRFDALKYSAATLATSAGVTRLISS